MNSDSNRHSNTVSHRSLLFRMPRGFFRERIAPLFPHVDFRNLRPTDLIRILLQALWLAVFRQNPPSFRPSVRVRWLRQRMKQGGKRLIRLIPGGLHQKLSWTHFRKPLEAIAGHDLRWSRPLGLAAYLLAAGILVIAIITPFSLLSQLVFMVLLWLIALSIQRIPGNLATLILVVLSVIASSRYLWWRINYTLNWDDLIDLTLGLGLLAAELFAWLVLILGYFQTARPLQRRPVELPANPAQWPTVDVFIPTYNEPLEVVKPTVYAALGMDWPKEKLNVYLLDDGRRPAFRQFAQEAGVIYMTRPDNSHAKAGNLNHALARSKGKFVAIFDCDHVPTRSFLQVNMGWFLRDPKLALMQTPHHFFSPDPFERNLNNFRTVPNENALFYGLVQGGNDLWNATFFCGSCAVLRRKPLEEIGGIAVETVTEDAHTALRLHRLGYNSAYLKIPQAAGLATESFAAHVGQRIRWARGMAQILRLDNPLLGKGLSIWQRLCYGNAMLHFLSGIPRLVFLSAPLAFLLLHAYIIYAPALLILLYVAPHLIHASITNSRIQGKYRYSFWAEIYETALAWYIARPTTTALIAPHKGSFNVTAKGGLIAEEHFDWRISKPFLVLIVLNLLGIIVGLGRLVGGPDHEVGTVLLNLAWASYNLLILGAALGVAMEARQVRRAHRVDFLLPAALLLPNGQHLLAEVQNFSLDGMSLSCKEDGDLKIGASVQVSLRPGLRSYAFPATLVRLEGNSLGLQFQKLTPQQEADLVKCTFGRADIWMDWAANRPHDRPLRSLKAVMLKGMEGYQRLFHWALPSHAQPLIRQTRSLLKYFSTYLPRRPAVQSHRATLRKAP
ncbi:MAG: UDP-forming cellulose synthase catalytic subunit [Gammaproteobacteria bacterium]|nr:UDP-forming cellulose synthase catalytic subunit [Gammaproteobacteria bacterium]